ncbi:MAG TPA: hypothetical protein VJT72_07745 [Pseudonocardiaceae bacterium]|nr:hypothetical protein [Pseudonocardiaceae bacterium]
MPDLNDGARAVRVLSQEIRETRRLQNEVARAILDKARQNASARPTPQARMVAEGLVVRRGIVLGRAGKVILGSGGRPVKLGHLAYGAEFGSNTHKQFGRDRRESGYWLHPAAEGDNNDTDKAEDSYLDRAISAAIRAAGF